MGVQIQIKNTHNFSDDFDVDLRIFLNKLTVLNDTDFFLHKNKSTQP